VLAASELDQFVEQEIGALGPAVLDHRLQRAEPVLGLGEVGVMQGG
jgi:hypothetical protein